MQEGVGEDPVVLSLLHNMGGGEVKSVEELPPSECSHRSNYGNDHNNQGNHRQSGLSVKNLKDQFAGQFTCRSGVAIVSL